jgi:hypothetical protein
MPFAEHFMLQGTFTVPSTFDATHPFAININTGFLPTKIELVDETLYGITSANQNLQTANWNFLVPNSTKIVFTTAAAATLNSANILANGISQYDGTKSVLLGPTIAGTTIVRATGVFTTAAHGLQIGDNIQITNNVVMKQLGGNIFTVATVPSATTFTVFNGAAGGFFSSAGFTADETGFVLRKVLVGPLFYPQRGLIVAATKASPLVLSISPNHGLTVGQQVRIRIPAVFGMTEANNLQGVITAISNSVTVSTITIGSIDSTAFTTFAWPLATSVPLNYAYIIPIGSGPVPVITPPFWTDDTLLDATANQQFQGFSVGTGLLRLGAAGTPGVQAGDIFTWTAWRADI